MMLFKKIMNALFISGIIFLSIFTQAQADASIKIEVNSGEEGFFLKYFIPGIGWENIKLEQPGDSDTITIRTMMVKIADVELTLNEITSNPPFVNLHYVISSQFFTDGDNETIEGDIPVPFGNFGTVLKINGKKLAPTGDSTLDASFLFKKDETKYDVSINCPLDIFGTKLNFDQDLKGQATPSDNLIHEQILNPVDESVMVEINIEVGYESPLFTVLNYEIVPNIPSPDIEEGEEDSVIPPIEGTIKMPNGSYHIWADMDVTQYLPDLP
jgi:hypothetical protein